MATRSINGDFSGLSESFLHAIIDHVALPIFVKNRAFRFVLVNRALCQLVGIERRELVGRTDYDFFPKAEADQFRRKDIEIFASGSTVVVDEEVLTSRMGERRILSTTKVPYAQVPGETVTHLVGIITDITRAKLTEEELRSSNEELERRVEECTAELRATQLELLRKERLAVLGQLAGGLAHQLRNPLAAIQNATSLLGRGYLDDKQRVSVDIIREEVWRADRTITGLLDYARVRPPERKPTDLMELIDTVLELEVLPESVALERRLSSTMVSVDPLQLQTALGNLVRNAVEAMPDGGTLTLAIEREGAFVRIVVQDTGEGVPPSAQAQLFNPLVTTKPLGIGLGLSTARNLVENQGGHLHYDDGRGDGAAFVVELPAVETTR